MREDSPKTFKSVLLSGTTLPLVVGAGVIAIGVTLVDTPVQAERLAGYYKNQGTKNPCAAKNPNMAKRGCNPCNPCAAKGCNPCSPCGPCGPCGAAAGPELSDKEADALYRKLKGKMTKAHKKSGLPFASYYQTWRRFNTVPYVSATHGSRYVNNYGNDKAGAYRKFEEAGKMPKGAILVKDSFTSVAMKGCNPCNPCAARNPCAAKGCNPCNPCNPCGAASKSPIGPLFVMEKMGEGFYPASGDWRYTMVLPNGQVFGTTKGKGSDKVEFCVTCHVAAEDYDHLMFLPDEYRKK